MSIIRAPRPDSNYYTLDKRISEDGRLGWAARGLLVYLLGKPDHWQVSVQALVNETAGSAAPSGRDAVYALLRQLIDVGYIQRQQERATGGSFSEHNYLVSETPLTGAPLTDSPVAVDPTQVSTDLLAKNDLKQSSLRSDSSTGDDLFDRPEPVTTNPAPDLDAEFEQFWLVYPRRIDKKAARAKFVTVRKRVPFERIMAGAKAYAAERRAEDPAYTKHPTTWLNKGSWENEPVATDRPHAVYRQASRTPDAAI